MNNVRSLLRCRSWKRTAFIHPSQHDLNSKGEPHIVTHIMQCSFHDYCCSLSESTFIEHFKIKICQE